MLKGNVSLITGGSRGIGAAVARKLASLGADVAIVYSGNAAAAEAVCGECEAFGVKAKAYQCNVADYAAAKTLVTACSTDSFTLSFVGQDPSFPLPEGRTRLYLSGASAAQVDSVAQQTGLKDPATHLVFLTEVHDTRFDTYSVLRPLDAAH